MLYHLETTGKLHKVQADAVRADLAVALTFAEIARQTSERGKAIRSQHNARRGYDVVLQFIGTARLTQFELESIRTKLELLKSALLGLGESL